MAQRQAECVVSPKETFRWTTPFFDLQFVEIKSKKPRSRSKHHSRSRSRERRKTSPNQSLSSNENQRRRMSSSQPAPASISERRMAKYKEERRRQLASQIANRLSSNHSSSSSDENENPDSNSSQSLESKFAKYRRHHHRSKQKEGQVEAVPALVDEAGVPPAVTRRRRRRSLTGKESASPARSPRVQAKFSVNNDADGEDDDDREDSPEHIYHQIGTNEVIRVKKTQASQQRQPRLPSKDKPTMTLPILDTGDHVTKKSYDLSNQTTANDKRKSMLNTSYSSEEILMQAASSLQGLEDEFRSSSQYLKNRSHKSSEEYPSSQQQQPLQPLISQPQQPRSSSLNKTLSSPEMIKSVTRTLTPPISPYHRTDQPRFSEAVSRVSPPSSTASNSSSVHNSVPISDPLIDMNWPGRPKRNSYGGESSSGTKTESTDKRRQVSPPIKTTTTASNTTSVSPSATASKPPIFPTSPKVLTEASLKEDMPPFMKEFVMRRQNNSNENTPVPTKRKTSTANTSNPALNRPHSAFIPRPNARSTSSDSRQADQQRRRSDFVSRYESLLGRAQAAAKAVDELDLLRLQRNTAQATPSMNNPQASEEAVEAPEDEDEEETSVDFNEEEVLQRCQDFQKDYEESKRKKQQPPVPKPRQLIGGRSVASAASTSQEPQPEKQEAPRPSLRMRSSSLTLHDKNNEVENSEDIQPHTSSKTTFTEAVGTSNQFFPKPILKKSSDDIRTTFGEMTKPILKRKDSESSLNTASTSGGRIEASSSNTAASGGILKRKSMTETEVSTRQEHVRIRSPSPDLEAASSLQRPPGILVRSRNSSLGEEEFPQSILKKRSCSQEDLMDGDISASAGTSGATSRSSPEPPAVHGILKRKLSLGSASPDPSNQIMVGAIQSILKKSGASTTHSSGQGSLEDLTSGSSVPIDGIKSILKKRHQCSTDDELEAGEHQEMQPKSILKSRRSEESLSPLSDDCVGGASGSSLGGHLEAVADIKPILKQRESSRDEGYHSSKLRDKSRSPSRGMTSPTSEVVFSGSSGVSTPLSNPSGSSSGGASARRSSLTFSPKRNVEIEAVEATSPLRKASFVSKTTVFVEPKKSLNLEVEGHERVKFDSSSLPTSPTAEDGPLIAASAASISGGILKRKGSMGSRQPPKFNSEMDENRVRKRSILKHDYEASEDALSPDHDLHHRQQPPRRGVLKKDSSYDDTLKPILKNPSLSDTPVLHRSSQIQDLSASSTSSEDLENLIDGNNRGFVDVVIDPLPKSVKESSEDETETPESQRQIPSPRKSSLGPRLPVIPPSSVKITSDGNLAGKLEALTGQAEAKLKQMALEEQRGSESQSKPPLNPMKIIPEKSLTAKNKTKSSILQRKGSQDLPASEYYAIYKKHSLNSSFSDETTSVKSVNSVKDTNEQDLLQDFDSYDDAMDTKVPTAEVKVHGGGIAERLALLKKSGEENWKKKVPTQKLQTEKFTNNSPKIINDNSNANLNDNGNNEEFSLRKKSGASGKVGSLQERLSQLQNAQTSWQNKVGEKDAQKFTVAGKMEIKPVAQPRKSRKESEMNLANDEMTSKIRVKKTPKFRRFHGSPPPENDRSYDEASTTSEATDFVLGEMVEIHELDEDLDKFFSSKITENDEKIDFDFDAIASEPSDAKLLLNVVKRPAANRNKRRSKNPVKALKNRTDIRQGYQQPGTISKMENSEISGEKKEKNVHSHLAAEAKAALAATEDFSSVQLKKDNKVVPHADFVPYKIGETMLLQIKGRRMCQTRLVAPEKASINSGDAYVALNGTDVVVWQGTFANVIEKSKSADLGQLIVQRRDLGCKKARRVLLVEEEKASDANLGNKLFWKMLGHERPQKASEAGPPDQDENYELEINDQNLIWTVQEESSELVPWEEYWGTPMKHDILANSEFKVLVFDFGPEVYVYNGKNAPFSTRRLGLKLAKDMIEDEQRPAWHLFGRINQNMETALFKEKFLNWPDKSRLIKTEKDGKKTKNSGSESEDLKLSTDVENNFDAIDMARWPLQEPNLELEGTFLGRGRSWYDLAERRQYEIETLSINFWHVTDKDIFELSEPEHGQFYSAGTFVVRWKYKVSLTGRTLKGGQSKHVAVGRERWAYFFWQGSDSKPAEQGLSALMTVELDEEKGPQIRVEQGHETAAFLNLWKGGMVVHKGRRGAAKDSYRLYFVKGECPEEACAIQVDCRLTSLRSRGCFILMAGNKSVVWMGRGVPEHKKAVVEALKQKWPELKQSSMIQEIEGQESSDLFKNAFSKSGNFQAELRPPAASMRLYHMNSVSGEFCVDEIVCPYLNQDVPNVLSFNQNDLYKVEQPALFLVESGTEKLWLWQGWWPDVGHEANDTNMSTGSGMIRWHAERREAMRTIKEFQRSKFSKISPRPNMELVWAGHEPQEFTNLFPFWTHHEDIENLNAEFLGDRSLDRTFALLGRDNYSWEELKQRPLPDGVDPSRLEKYLSEDDFVTHLGLSRADFMAAPRWKQLEIRKEKGLF